jgi:hypothetical protein
MRLSRSRCDARPTDPVSASAALLGENHGKSRAEPGRAARLADTSREINSFGGSRLSARGLGDCSQVSP